MRPRLLQIAVFLISFCLTGMPGSSPEVQEADPGFIPFYGERLVYSIQWDPPWFLFFLPKMEAGEAEVRLLGETEYRGGKAVKILFMARSSGVLVSLSGVKIDDEFTFFAEPGTFCSLGSAKRIREGKRKRQVDVEYLRDKGQLHIREMDESTEPPKLKKDEIKSNIPSCVLDPLSALYGFRTAQLRPDYSQTFLIGYDDRVKEIRSRVEGREDVVTPAGRFSAWRVSTAALMGGLFKEGGQFKIWLSSDGKQIPVQFEAKVSLGRALGKLRSVADSR
jgi:hypothetical protein